MVMIQIGRVAKLAAVRVLLCFGLMVLTTPLWAAVAVLAVGYEVGLAAWSRVRTKSASGLAP